ncbi:hypothetical protein [Nostoc sp. TCL26-01]|uniref:hypothetical protein n=1 Tax=Nostoc sp. TCL26-01 TaxID=2576904 RepID=UPI0015B8D42E|nr:hypothetical protein [Nostoc sp. TCL26-01]QLE54168.1 hypothetical protein FD725_00665 [Nostoc sp. TCL26-01]
MLKSFFLSGWFRTQPFINYVVVAIVIAPLVAASGHSSSAKQSPVIAKTAVESESSDSVSQEVAVVNQPDLAGIVTASQTNSTAKAVETIPQQNVVAQNTQISSADNLESLLAKEYSRSNSSKYHVDPLAAVELAPDLEIPRNQKLKIADLPSQKDQEILRQVSQAYSLIATQVAPSLQETQPNSTPEVAGEQPNSESAAQVDPIGSPHPIPWQWIVATQETIGARGMSGVRYYRSVPVISPDGKYAVYSRVQIEVKPDMYNSKVNSVLFVEDRETKKLRVMATTNVTSDPLLNKQAGIQEQSDGDGQIGVLVPVSWSEKSDRFLARKFEGVFNTGDSTDRAVIWDRQKNQTNTVAPASDDEHEKIAVLLGWSKNEPDHVLFRAGELGEEDWPLVKVAVDGKTVTTTNTDQPVTFGEKLTQVWAGPQVASR